MQDASLVPVGVANLVLAYGMVLFSMGLARLRGIGQEKHMLWSSLRMVVQLFAVGYLLHLVFALAHPLPVLGVLLVMAAFALQVVGGRIRNKMPRFYRVVGSALILGCGASTFFICTFVVGYTPWHDPRYLIPLAGMILGNSLNGASLAAERLASEMRERREELECALCLGADARQASMPAVRSAFRAALLPTVNTMAAMGIVSLPGMMTGQILSGTDPVTAVRYQIAIMCAITASVALTAYLIVVWGYRSYFSDAHQLTLE